MTPPLGHPCGSCPYRADAPSGLWHAEEYDKLKAFDEPIFHLQPPSVFLCHQQTGQLCAGWVGCHDMQNSLGLRLAVAGLAITPEQYDEALDYTSPVPLHESGAEAAAHGRAEIDEPSERARRTAARLQKKLDI